MFVFDLVDVVGGQKDDVLLVYPPDLERIPFVKESEIPISLAWNTLKWYVSAGRIRNSHNGKKDNQDRVLVYYDAKSNSLLLGIFDGHGKDGHDVASFVRNCFLSEFLRENSFSREDVLQQMERALSAAEKRLVEESTVDSKRSGCTANIGLLRSTKRDCVTLYSVNVGDSEYALCFPSTLGAICRSRGTTRL